MRGAGGKGLLTGDDVLLRAQQVRDADLLDVRELLLEVVREREGDDGEAGVVVRGGLAVLALVVLARLVLDLALGAVDVADAAVPACRFERFAEQAGVCEAVFHDRAVAVEAEVDQVVVLRDDLGARAGEVEGEGFFSAAQVVKLEDQVLGQVAFVAPNDPADAGIDETELQRR